MENKSNAKKDGRGGKREGAGRKCIGDVKRLSLTISVTPETRAKIQALADEQGISISELFNRWAETL